MLHIKRAIDIVEAVYYGIGPLRCLDGLLDAVRAALILAVGNQNERLPAHLSLELIGRRKHNGIVQDRPLGLVDSRDRTRMQTSNVGVHMQSLETRSQKLGGIGVVLQQLGIRSEADQKRQVLFPQDRAEKWIGRVVFDS